MSFSSKSLFGLFAFSMLTVMLASPNMATAADDSLLVVLSHVYETNPEIESARYQLREIAVDEDLASAGYRPSISASAGIGLKETTVGTTTGGTVPRQYDVSISQPLFRGGTTVADISEARQRIQAQTALLSATTQDILLETATAYLDVVTAIEIFELNKKNEKRLEKQLDSEQKKFDVGQSTKTDVSQAKARLARAKSDRVTAYADVVTQKANYQRLVGEPFPERDDLSLPKIDLPFPASPDEALDIAKENSPELVATEFIAQAADDAIDAAWGQLLPQVRLDISSGARYDSSPFSSELEENQALVIVDVPIYQSGELRARKRQAEEISNRRRVDIYTARRQLESDVVDLWQRYHSTQSEIEATKAQVEASTVALEGVREESRVGSRTTLDVLDAEQELLDAQVSYVQAQRDHRSSHWQLLRQIGWFVPKILNIKTDTVDKS